MFFILKRFKLRSQRYIGKSMLFQNCFAVHFSPALYFPEIVPSRPFQANSLGSFAEPALQGALWMLIRRCAFGFLKPSN